jgi:hypothetical protein
VAFLGRALTFEPRQVEVMTSEALARHFGEAAEFLSGIWSAPALALLDGVIATVVPDSVLGFSLVLLRRGTNGWQSRSEVTQGNRNIGRGTDTLGFHRWLTIDHASVPAIRDVLYTRQQITERGGTYPRHRTFCQSHTRTSQHVTLGIIGDPDDEVVESGPVCGGTHNRFPRRQDDKGVIGGDTAHDIRLCELLDEVKDVDPTHVTQVRLTAAKQWRSCEIKNILHD